MKPRKVDNREVWLRNAYALLRKELLPEAPESIAVGWGFPSKGAVSRRRTVGQCWHGNAVRKTRDRVILISPVLSDPVEVVDTLLHEMIHAAYPGAGHRRQFSQVAKRVGLLRPWTMTAASPELRTRIRKWIADKLGPWPKGHLIVTPKEKGRQRKAVCKCGRILRCAAGTFDRGPIICGVCGKPFKMEE